MSKIAKITKHEFKATAGNKAFIVITILGPFLIIAIAVLPTLFTAKSGDVRKQAVVALVGAPDRLFEAVKPAAEKSNIRILGGGDIENLKQQVMDEKINGLIIIPGNYMNAKTLTYFSRSGTDIYLSETIGAIVGNEIVAQRLAEEGIDYGKIKNIIQRPAVQTMKLDSGRKEDFFSIIMTSIAFVMLIYMTVLLYGQMIGRAVLVEKTSKTVEIMLSSVKPNQLMYGKILGRGLAGILQYAIWIFAALLFSKILGPVLNIQMPASLTAVNLLFMVLFFILAFFLYSSLFAALGSGAEDEQHLAQLGLPLIIFLVIPMVFVSYIIMNPGSVFVIVLSFFPLTAPIIMFMRIIISTPPAWQILLSIADILLSIILSIYLATKIFRVGILMTGKRFSISEIIKWAKY